ncbi:MAG: DnaJ domain-containing protein [Acidobacteriaceae bacterium]
MAIEKSKFDYYEFLQISPRADQETIHRVYRFLAARFHPDNPESGNPDKFAMLTVAYDVLSDPERRAEFDASREKEGSLAPPLSNTIDFMDSVAGELNRRLAVLAVLYFRRRANPLYPEVSLAELETRMGFPRDYLDFTTWYLQKKGYITRADNSDFTLTAAGVDFVEMQRANIPVLNKLLTDGSAIGANPPDERPSGARPTMILLPDMTLIPDRRKSSKERRKAGRDRHALSTETEGLKPLEVAEPKRSNHNGNHHAN